MKPVLLKILLLAFFVLLFDLFFWEKAPGLNLVLFFVLLGGASLWQHKGALRAPHVRLTLAGTLLAGTFFLLYGSLSAGLVFVLSFAAFQGFVLLPAARSLPAALGNAISNVALAPGHFAQELATLPRLPRRGRRPLTVLSLSLVPLVVALVFLVLFRNANPRFDALVGGVLDGIGEFLGEFFSAISLAHLFFLLLGLFVALAVLYARGLRGIREWDAHATETLSRKGVRAMMRRLIMRFRMLALKREFVVALILVWMVNLIAFVVNIIDINWIWFGFEVPENFDLKQFVHEGTYLLIVSILLAMGIMFYYFRGNLNFYTRNKWLRIGCYVWIAQNVVLVISVFLRNYHYMDFHGLAYKRIGVLFFLALTLFGLWTLYQKIRHQRTFFHVVRRNAWATYAILLVIAAVNWDVFIVKYNIAQYGKADIDIEFLLLRSDKTLPIVDQHRHIFEGKHFQKDNRVYGENMIEFLDKRIVAFRKRSSRRHWMGWNLADANAKTYFGGRKRTETP